MTVITAIELSDSFVHEPTDLVGSVYAITAFYICGDVLKIGD